MGQIHHCPAIHAKTVIGESLAVLGSANLTRTGILARTEMAVLLEDPVQVSELSDWFDALWQQTDSPRLDETSAFVKWLDAEAAAATVKANPSISSPSRKVRAKLATIAMGQPDQTEQTIPVLDLSAMAAQLAQAAQVQEESLEHAVASGIAALADSGFALRELVAAVQLRAGMLSPRDVYQALIKHCANHFRSVFEAGTINRLLVIEGRFIRSTPESIFNCLAPFDSFLTVIIHYLDFDEPRPLPEPGQLAKLSTLRPVHQQRLIASLCGTGLLLAAGDRFSLAEDFEWSSRFLLFVNAHRAWAAALLAKRQSSASHPALIGKLRLATASASPDDYARILPAEPIDSRRAATTPATVSVAPASPETLPGAEADPNGWQASLGNLRNLIAQPKKEKVKHVPDGQDAKDRADFVYWHLVRLVAKQGSALPFKGVQDLAKTIHRLAGRGWPTLSVVEVLEGRLPGVPKLVATHFVAGSKLPCHVKLLVPIEALADYPLTNQAVRQLNALKSDFFEIFDPWTADKAKALAATKVAIAPRIEVPGDPDKPGIPQLPVAQLGLPTMQDADRVFSAVIQLLVLHGNPLPFDHDDTLHRAIRALSNLTTHAIIAILKARTKDIPELFAFDYGKVREDRCTVRQYIQPLGTLANFPHTRDAMKLLPAGVLKRIIRR